MYTYIASTNGLPTTAAQACRFEACNAKHAYTMRIVVLMRGVLKSPTSEVELPKASMSCFITALHVPGHVCRPKLPCPYSAALQPGLERVYGSRRSATLSPSPLVGLVHEQVSKEGPHGDCRGHVLDPTPSWPAILRTTRAFFQVSSRCTLGIPIDCRGDTSYNARTLPRPRCFMRLSMAAGTKQCQCRSFPWQPRGIRASAAWPPGRRAKSAVSRVGTSCTL